VTAEPAGPVRAMTVRFNPARRAWLRRRAYERETSIQAILDGLVDEAAAADPDPAQDPE
jgi:hypothetical protein